MVQAISPIAFLHFKVTLHSSAYKSDISWQRYLDPALRVW